MIRLFELRWACSLFLKTDHVAQKVNPRSIAWALPALVLGCAVRLSGAFRCFDHTLQWQVLEIGCDLEKQNRIGISGLCGTFETCR